MKLRSNELMGLLPSLSPLDRDVGLRHSHEDVPSSSVIEGIVCYCYVVHSRGIQTLEVVRAGGVHALGTNFAGLGLPHGWTLRPILLLSTLLLKGNGIENK